MQGPFNELCEQVPIACAGQTCVRKPMTLSRHRTRVPLGNWVRVHRLKQGTSELDFGAGHSGQAAGLQHILPQARIEANGAQASKQGRAGQGRAGQGRAGQGRAGQGKAINEAIKQASKAKQTPCGFKEQGGSGTVDAMLKGGTLGPSCSVNQQRKVTLFGADPSWGTGTEGC